VTFLLSDDYSDGSDPESPEEEFPPEPEDSVDGPSARFVRPWQRVGTLSDLKVVLFNVDQ